jgi:hypothetical protein
MSAHRGSNDSSECSRLSITSDGSESWTDQELQLTTAPGPVVVGIDADETGNDGVNGQAFEEARLRGAPLLALRVTRWHPGEVPYDRLDRRLLGWMQRNPDVSVLPVDARPDDAHYLETHDMSVQLTVIGRAEAYDVTRLVGPHDASMLPHAGCSVFVVDQ